jgi:predicted nucleotidyltransferase
MFDPEVVAETRREVAAMVDAHGASLVYLVVSGSHATGLAGEGSDIDIRGVFIPPVNVLLGMDKLETLEIKSKDVVLHSASKFVKLCTQGNPNALDWLFVPDACVLVESPAFSASIVRPRDMFLSKNLHARFKGYASGQLAKMRSGGTRELGEKRKADMEKYGYSTKNAMHAVRLVRMGLEVLKSGTYSVLREDREELLAIRRGVMKLSWIESTIESHMDSMDDAVLESPLYDTPNRSVINMALVALHSRFV